MPETAPAAALDLTALAAAKPSPGRIGGMAAGLSGSEILRIAGEIRAVAASGRAVADLTVGDFAPHCFPVPAALAEGIREAVSRGETNYPPSSGLAALREAIARWYARDLGLEYGTGSVLVAGGSRPLIYGTFRTLCDPGDRVVYPVPSWNNNHYAHLVGAVGVPVACGAGSRFLPTADALAAPLRGARLLSLNTPLNPAGTTLSADTLAAICDLVLEENRGREARGERPLYVMYDQVYWTLTYGGEPHPTPPGVRPEIARYTVFVDGISKAFAATGLRVGWAVGPADVIAPMSGFMGHVGAWAPRPEQVATAALLDDPAAVAAFLATFKDGLARRLRALHRGLEGLRGEGLPVDAIPPAGAMYVAARVHPFGRRGPKGRVLRTNDDVRRLLLDEAGVAVVPFQAFGMASDDGWFRLSVGAVAEDEIAPAVDRIAAALRRLD
jgi:aspartate aminotransferase